MTKTIDTLQVTKRDGSLEAFDLTQIREAINFAVGDTGLNPLKLETAFTQSIYDGVETSKIQDALIVAAANLVSAKEPNWKYVAGRLITWSRQHRLSKLGINYEPETLYSYTVTKLKEGIYSELLHEYTNEQLLTAFSWINPDYDHDYDIFGAEILEKRYLLKDEPLQLAYLLTALIIAIPEKNKDARMKFAFKLYHAVAQRKISLATPILANMRKAKGSISSCFIITMEDDLKSIMREVSNAAFISKNGGGVGANVSRIRATGSQVMGNDNASGGVIPWIKLLNDTAIAVNQGGRRAGAITVSLDIWHLDILEFLEMQTENGDQRRKAYDVFPQIVLNDVFNGCVLADSSWYLVCPYEIKKYYGVDIASLWGDEFEDFYLQLSLDIASSKYPGRHKRVNAKDLFKSIMKTCVETGLPYLVQKDEINRANPNKHEGYIPGTNLCVAPETKILTKDGYHPIIDLLNKDVEVWNGEEWSATTVVKTGENQKLIKVNLSNGESIECTPYHKFYVQTGCSRQGSISKVEAKDLMVGAKLIKFNLPIIDNASDIEMDYAYTHGFFCGDGSYTSSGHPEIDLYHEKRELLPSIEVRNKFYGGGFGDKQWRIERDEVAVYDDVKQKRIVCKLPLDIQPKFFVPINGYTINSRLTWLSGLMDADGCVVRNGTNESLQISSIHKQFLLDVRLMLQTLGVDAKVVNGYPAGLRMMPNGKGGNSEYYCKETHRLLISSTGLYKLAQLGFVTNRLKWSVRKPNRNAEQFIQVKSIEDTGRISDTYCFTEHKRNMGMFNGILTGQCVESFSNTGIIQLPNGEKQKVAHTCNLISLNLHTINTFSPELEKMCRIAVRALDNSIDVNTPSFEDSKIHNQRYRTIGVGTMGLADWMVKNNLRYSKISDKDGATHRLVNDLYENIAYFTAMESVDLAKERGAYPAYEGSEWSKGLLLGSKTLEDIQQRAINVSRWNDLAYEIRKHGIRNSQITAIAPNTSSALVQGCTASILPVFSRMFEEKWSKGKMFNSPPLIADNPMAYEENIHLDQNHIIDFVKLIQFWIDTGISMELVFNPNEGAYFDEGVYYEANPKHVFDVLTKSFDGIKAVYYQRFVSKGESEKSVCFVCAN